VKFVIDTQLPPRLAMWLRARGHEAVHVEDVGLREADDSDILRYTTKIGAIVITKDRDFSAVPPRVRPAQVLWIRIGNAVNRVLLARLEAEWPIIESALEAGAPVVELR
jgi:predicted nuclease of predicted toxin-antitoxin system